MFEGKDQELKDEVTYFVILPGQFRDEKAIYEEDIPKDSGEWEPDQYYSKDSSDVFVGPTAEGDFVRLQRNFCQKYGKHNEHSQYILEAMHTAVPITFTSIIYQPVMYRRR